MTIMTTTGNGPAAQTLRGLLATTGAGPAAEAPAQRGTARRAVETAGPARTVAAAVHAAGGVDAPAARRLRELAAQLGDSATRWLGVHDALVRHRGTLPALLAAVPAPAPPAAPGQTRPPEPRSVPATLALLLEHAAPEAAATALAALPDRTLEHLLAGGALPGPSLTAGSSHTATPVCVPPSPGTRGWTPGCWPGCSAPVTPRSAPPSTATSAPPPPCAAPSPTGSTRCRWTRHSGPN
ncbi:hypothetical protein ADL27_51685 [Streptomyces sp. NRRL F-6602]|nr:hypothetical protein ADL27_51685 [Streptomyces sp. NRRL F-6602]